MEDSLEEEYSGTIIPPSSMAKARPKKLPQEIPVISQDIKYCNSIHVRASLEEAILSIQSGNSVIAQYALSLSHIKRLRNSLDTIVKAYEKIAGPIDTHQKSTTK